MDKAARVGIAILAVMWAGVLCAGEEGAKMGFVDIEKVFDRYQKTIDLNVKLEHERKDRIAQRKLMVEEINRLKDEVKLLRGEAKEAKDALVDKKVKELYAYEERVKKEAMEKQAALQEEILREIQQVIDEFGARDGYAALFTRTGDDMGYHAARLDITEKVVSYLNSRYEKTQKEHNEKK